jgi:hypothetical protein
MKKILAIALLGALGIALLGAWAPADARQAAGMALLDQPGGDTSVACGARRGNGPASFTYHVTVANSDLANAETVRVQYADGSTVDYPLAAGASFSFSGVGGSTAGVDDVITVSGVNGTLVGSMSILLDPGAKPHQSLNPNFCATQ